MIKRACSERVDNPRKIHADHQWSAMQRRDSKRFSPDLFPMNKKQDENSHVAPPKTLDDNWNERKHLVELEFELRSNTEELIEKNAPREEIDKARHEEAECRATLTKNSDQYEALVTAWIGEAPKEHVARLA
jgi:hypothetical protein